MILGAKIGKRNETTKENHNKLRFLTKTQKDSLLVFLDAGVVDDAAPVEAESEIVGVAVGILIAAEVTRHVFKLFLDSLHVGRHLHRKQGGGFRLAADDVE